MIFCPFCGHHLASPLLNGMSSCTNCCRVFDSSKQNILLSTAWLVRKRDITDIQYLIDHVGSTHEDASFVIEHVADGCMSHEEFFLLLKEEFKIEDKRKAS